MRTLSVLIFALMVYVVVGSYIAVIYIAPYIDRLFR
jgi:hypothetical protein